MALVLCAALVALPASGLPPAGVRPPSSSRSTAILPGGRVVAPLGEQLPTGAGAIGLTMSGSGKNVLSVNADPEMPSLTLMEKTAKWEVQQIRITRSSESGAQAEVSGGVVFSGEHAAFVSEGGSGQIELIDLTTGERRRTIDLNQEGAHNSFAGAMAFDPRRELLYVADRANSRVVMVDARTRQIVASLRVMDPPRALALSADRRTLYIAASVTTFADVTDARNPKLADPIRTGNQPTAILAAGGQVYIADAAGDSVIAIDAGSRRVEWILPIYIPGMEKLRGILPSGLTLDEKTGWLLVAETGINAVGVIDTHERRVLGHLPAGWRPTQVLVRDGNVFVANARGLHAGPPSMKEGSVSVYRLPSASELPTYTEYVMRANGFVSPLQQSVPPPGIRYALLIVKGARSFDEILGDLTEAGNGAVMAAPALAHLGSRGYADGERKRLSLQRVNVTPNQNAIARQFSFSDNFYADSPDGNEAEAEGFRWLESEPLWEHISRNGIPYRRFVADRNSSVSDTDRAAKFIQTIDAEFVKTAAELPRLLYLELPNDSIGRAQPERGYLYPESPAADNDSAVGLVLEFLSKTRWWKDMAVFVTEAASSGFDHIEAHRTLLLCAGPWAKRNFVSHTNTSLPGLLKTIFEILHIPEMDLSVAAAADLSDCFRDRPDNGTYQALPMDARIYASPARR